MSGPRQRPVIGPRPAPTAATAWVRRGDGQAPVYSARLTIDVTPALRGRIKMAAYQRSVTVAAMLRALLEREFQQNKP
ncbi:chromosome partitioning protein ParB [Achromobacter mucicolens]|uniref:Chromosome partitioning protein ParB n=1 Tax=Achromobacter mucicolens TaxID=1389922 RepID=A0ABD4YX77_9BURK|nr:chromosome partitioning protein ParB [Achromobacter mucicolens]MDH1180077.1 chromosome partitioning protein ParB [Achromobacter mucicolens]